MVINLVVTTLICFTVALCCAFHQLGSFTNIMFSLYYFFQGSSGESTLASHQCDPSSIPGLGVTCGLSVLLALVLAPRGFSPGTPIFTSPQKPTLLNSNSIWKVSPITFCAKYIETQIKLLLFIYTIPN